MIVFDWAIYYVVDYLVLLKSRPILSLPWSLLLILKAHTVPMMCQASRFTFPVLKKCHS